MKRIIVSLLLILLIVISISASAYADAKEWTITFLPNGTMDSGGITSKKEGSAFFDDVISNLEPGDTEEFKIHIVNSHAQTTRWYMLNEVLASLERSAKAGAEIAGGAYTYKLIYAGPGATSGRILFDSSKIGGDDTGVDWNKIGLEEATADLSEYFFLDTLNSKETGTVTLSVHLEGETQGNAYQNTAAQLAMRFAVELANTSPPGSTTRTAVKTGDEHNLIPYYVAMVVTGLLFLYFALDAYTDRLYKKGKD